MLDKMVVMGHETQINYRNMKAVYDLVVSEWNREYKAVEAIHGDAVDSFEITPETLAADAALEEVAEKYQNQHDEMRKRLVKAEDAMVEWAIEKMKADCPKEFKSVYNQIKPVLIAWKTNRQIRNKVVDMAHRLAHN